MRYKYVCIKMACGWAGTGNNYVTISLVLNHVTTTLQWSGIIVNWYSDVAGLKFKVENSAIIRKHFEVIYVV